MERVGISFGLFANGAAPLLRVFGSTFSAKRQFYQEVFMSWQYKGLWLFLVTCTFVLGGNPALAQQTVGAMTGTVMDSTGAVQPGVKVAIKNISTGLEVAATT